MAPPPIDDKKNKRKDRGKKPLSSRHSLKKARTESQGAGLSNAEHFAFFKGINFSLSFADRGAVNVASTEELANAYFEMQSRTLAFAKVLHIE